MTTLSVVQETPGQSAASIVFTSGSTAIIRAPASKVFGIITDYRGYEKWNSWTPKFDFYDGQPLHIDSEGVLTTKQDGGADLQIPLKVNEVCTGYESIKKF